MSVGTAAESLIRRRLLEQIYDRMSDEEKHLFVQMTLQGSNHNEIMQALQQQSAKIDRLQKTQQTFGEDFLSNIAGNAAYDGALWVLRRLSRLLR
jgi:hypothetical protein